VTPVKPAFASCVSGGAGIKPIARKLDPLARKRNRMAGESVRLRAMLPAQRHWGKPPALRAPDGKKPIPAKIS